jgi:hypothetical protein
MDFSLLGTAGCEVPQWTSVWQRAGYEVSELTSFLGIAGCMVSEWTPTCVAQAEMFGVVDQ